jgi:hypothetical protein
MRLASFIVSGTIPLVIGVLSIYYTNVPNADIAQRTRFTDLIILLMLIGIMAIVALGFADRRERLEQQRNSATIAGAAEESLQQAIRSERFRFTDGAIKEMTSAETASALNHIGGGQGHGGDKALAKAMFDGIDLRSPVNERPEPYKSYMLAVGHYDNLFDRTAAYADAGLIDEDLFFGQAGETICIVYLILREFVWENPILPQRKHITQFVARAFLHYAKTTEKPWLGTDDLDFLESRARELYPGPETEEILTKVRSAYHNVWREVYLRPEASKHPLTPPEAT